MIRLAIILAALALAGCDQRMNPGADLAVIRIQQADMQRRFAQSPFHRVCGAYSHKDGTIYLAAGLSADEQIATFAHELAHAFDHQKPRDLWELLARYQSPDFDFNPHDKP